MLYIKFASVQEQGSDPRVDAAAAYAIQQLTQQSNSLFPFQLIDVVSASKTLGQNGDKEGITHHLRLKVKQGNMPEQTFDVDVIETTKGHILKSSTLLV